MSAFSPRQPYLLNVVPARVQCARSSDEPLRCRVDLQTLAYLNRVRENIWIRQCPSVNTATWISTTRPVRPPTLDLLDEAGDGGPPSRPAYFAACSTSARSAVLPAILRSRNTSLMLPQDAADLLFAEPWTFHRLYRGDGLYLNLVDYGAQVRNNSCGRFNLSPYV